MRVVGGILATLTWAAFAHATPLAFVTDARVGTSDVRLADVAETADLPQTLRAEARALTLTTLPRGAVRQVYSVRRLAERARALMPALGPWLADAGDGQVTVVVDRSPSRDTPQASCLSVVAPLAVGSIPRASDFVPTVCAHPVAGAFRFRRQDGVAEVTRDLKIGDETRSVPLADLAHILPGQPLYVSAQVGSVRVERAVTAVQPAASSRAVFVRSEEGAGFPAPPAEAQP